ncbi:unnamed protein product [Brassica napus]|uniref:CoA carboxyltransferase N-terminal domain-containing protein n=2 Tax=Brassica TaxID=3705 RepID=A0A0D3ANZ6_BRAOL|nr:unnamed protein product [Brassica napus]
MYKNVEMNICEECGHYLKITISERIELSIDPGTWNPMDKDRVTSSYDSVRHEDSQSRADLMMDNNVVEQLREEEHDTRTRFENMEGLFKAMIARQT